MNAEKFWNRVNFLIKENNTTQQSLSVTCGFNPRRIQNLSTGNRFPDVQEGILIAQVLNTTVEYLVTGKESSPYKEELDSLKSDLRALSEKYSH